MSRGCYEETATVEFQLFRFSWHIECPFSSKKGIRGKQTTVSSYTVSQKNDNDVLRYNFNVHQPILIILAEILLNEYAIKW